MGSCKIKSPLAKSPFLCGLSYRLLGQDLPPGCHEPPPQLPACPSSVCVCGEGGRGDSLVQIVALTRKLARKQNSGGSKRCPRCAWRHLRAGSPVNEGWDLSGWRFSGAAGESRRGGSRQHRPVLARMGLGPAPPSRAARSPHSERTDSRETRAAAGPARAA